MHHGVDAGGGRNGGRQSQRQFGVEDGPVGQQAWRHDALLLVGGRRHDGDGRHFGARARGRRHEDQRQTPAFRQSHAVEAVERLVGTGQIGDELGGIERRAAADREHEVDALGSGLRGRLLHDGGRRIRQHAVEDRKRHAGTGERLFGTPGQSGVAHTGIRHEQDVPGGELTHDLGHARHRTRREDDVGTGLEREGVHANGSVTVVSRSGDAAGMRRVLSPPRGPCAGPAATRSGRASVPSRERIV